MNNDHDNNNNDNNTVNNNRNSMTVQGAKHTSNEIVIKS